MNGVHVDRRQLRAFVADPYMLRTQALGEDVFKKKVLEPIPQSVQRMMDHSKRLNHSLEKPNIMDNLGRIIPFGLKRARPDFVKMITSKK